MITFDLHMHSIYSPDGEKTPLQLITLAKEAGLSTIALSDHNTPQGIDEMIALGKQEGIRIIPAIEFDTLFEDLEVHVLGYQIDYHQSYFQKLREHLLTIKKDTVDKRLEKLNSYYHMEVTKEEVINKYGSEQLWPNIIKYILEDPRYIHISAFDDYRKGGCRSVPQSVNFYWDLCSTGTPCHVRVDYPSLQDTVQQIHQAGGIAVIAHPWRNFYHREDLLQQAIAQGIDGIEAYSNYHNVEHNIYYENFCKQHDLIITCGSDYHGSFKPNIRMGEYGYSRDDSEEILKKFLARINEKKTVM